MARSGSAARAPLILARTPPARRAAWATPWASRSAPRAGRACSMTSEPGQPRIWITRARPGAEATASRLRDAGFEPVIAPVLEARPIADAAVDLTGVDALAFTSAAGVAAFVALKGAP